MGNNKPSYNETVNLNKKNFKFTKNQKLIINSVLDDNSKMVFVDGPAGTSKTFLSVYTGLKLLFEKKIDRIVYTRTAVESSRCKLGFRPGEVDQKFSHFIIPLREKLDEILGSSNASKFIKNEKNNIEAIPINDLRGVNWEKTFVILDEAQNCDFEELVTITTRLADQSKIVLVGDEMQSDVSNSGWRKFISIFEDVESQSKGIFSFQLNEEDIVRSDFVKFIIKKIKYS